MRIAIRQKFVFNDAMEKANRSSLLYFAQCTVRGHAIYVLNHAQANNIKGVLTGMQAVLLSRCIHCNVNCA